MMSRSSGFSTAQYMNVLMISICMKMFDYDTFLNPYKWKDHKERMNLILLTSSAGELLKA